MTTTKRQARERVDTPECLRIGNTDQWLLERSEDLANPIVLFVHGGPGTSQLTSNRRNTCDLERYFTVVNWDQRGSGKSYAAIRDVGAMNIDQFVDDTRELTRQLLEKFGKERLVLVGHSWGSAIGALAVARSPELYSCYVGIGQIANMAEGFEALRAPSKRVVWFESSAHLPNAEERDRFNQVMRDDVRAVALPIC